MNVNVGKVDKVIRIILGLAIIIVVGLVMKSWWGLIGILPLATGLAGRCGLYNIFGISTCSTKETSGS